MWRIHNYCGKFPSLTTTVAIWHDEWITRLPVLFYFKLFLMHMENYHLSKSSATTTSPRLPAPTQHPSGQGLPAITIKRSRQRCAFSKAMGDSFGSLICFQLFFFVSFWCWSSSLFWEGVLFLKFISVLEAIFLGKQFWAYFRMWIYQNIFLYKLLNSFTPQNTALIFSDRQQVTADICYQRNDEDWRI